MQEIPQFIQIFIVNLHNLYFFLLLSNLLCLLQLKKTLHKVIFFNLFELDPDPHFLGSWIRIRIKKNSWIRIRIHKK